MVEAQWSWKLQEQLFALCLQTDRPSWHINFRLHHDTGPSNQAIPMIKFLKPETPHCSHILFYLQNDKMWLRCGICQASKIKTRRQKTNLCMKPGQQLFFIWCSQFYPWEKTTSLQKPLFKCIKGGLCSQIFPVLSITVFCQINVPGAEAQNRP